jgi:hypothetical protein
MFKVRELIAQTSMSIAGFLLTVVNSRLYFDEKPFDHPGIDKECEGHKKGISGNQDIA